MPKASSAATQPAFRCPLSKARSTISRANCVFAGRRLSIPPPCTGSTGSRTAPCPPTPGCRNIGLATFPNRAVLPGHPHRLPALLGEIGSSTQTASGCSSGEGMETGGSVRNRHCDTGTIDRFSALRRSPAWESLEIMTAVVSRLPAAKQGTEVSVPQTPRGRRIHFPAGGSSYHINRLVLGPRPRSSRGQAFRGDDGRVRRVRRVGCAGMPVGWRAGDYGGCVRDDGWLPGGGMGCARMI